MRNSMLRSAAMLLIVFSAALAAAGDDINPKFVATNAAANGLEVEITWRESGLWPEMLIHNAVVGEATATYVCLEGGQTRLADRLNVDDLVRSEGEFTATRRGVASGMLSLKPPQPGMFSCAPGQRLKIACVMYTQLSCKDDTYAVSSDLRRTMVLFEPGYSQFCNLDLR